MGLERLAHGLRLFGAGCGAVFSALTQTVQSAQQLQSLVGRFQRQRHAVLAVLAHGAAAVAEPLAHLAIGRQVQFGGNFIGRAQAALHPAFKQPMALTRLDVQLLDLVGVVELQAAAPGACTAQQLQRWQGEPQVVV